MTDARVDFPVLEHEMLTWSPSNPDLFSRREVERQSGDYRAAVTPAMAEWSMDVPAPLLADVEDATRELARMDGYASGALGMGVSGPMPSILLRSESASSSQIEQLTTSALQLAMAAIDESTKANAAAVLGNVLAMQAAIGGRVPVSTETLLEMHRLLFSESRSMVDEAGRFRRQQVWIGPGAGGPRLADFVPPRHQRIPEAISDLMTFIGREDLPVLIQAAVAHAQFETIHPFTDGNGRTGRALIHAILKDKGLVTDSVVPLSAGLLADVETYFAALDAFRSGDAGLIIARFAGAARFAGLAGRKLMDDLAAAMGGLEARLEGVRSDSSAWRLLRLLISQPVVNLRFVTEALSTNDVTALRALETLRQRDILRESTGRRRNRVWRQPDVLGVLDSFAEGIRRSSS